jgi:hypothetical protein
MPVVTLTAELMECTTALHTLHTYYNVALVNGLARPQENKARVF